MPGLLVTLALPPYTAASAAVFLPVCSVLYPFLLPSRAGWEVVEEVWVGQLAAMLLFRCWTV